MNVLGHPVITDVAGPSRRVLPLGRSCRFGGANATSRRGGSCRFGGANATVLGSALTDESYAGAKEVGIQTMSFPPLVDHIESHNN